MYDVYLDYVCMYMGCISLYHAVDIQQLSCEQSSGAMVCGSNGQSYRSACDLYRETFGRVYLRHQGDCASEDCPDEMVGNQKECAPRAHLILYVYRLYQHGL